MSSGYKNFYKTTHKNFNSIYTLHGYTIPSSATAAKYKITATTGGINAAALAAATTTVKTAAATKAAKVQTP